MDKDKPTKLMNNFSVISTFVIWFICIWNAECCVNANGEPGACVHLNNCRQLRDLVTNLKRNPNRSQKIQFLKRSICRYSSGIPHFCCKHERPNNPGNGNPGFSQPLQKPSAPRPPAQCGRAPLGDRIILGIDATVGEYPWAALLFGSAGRGESQPFCGGSLITERHVLTAAHCVRDVNLRTVRLGEHTISSRIDCDENGCAPTVQDVPVTRTYVHPSYSHPCEYCNDIAIIKLSRPAKIDLNYVSPICLPGNLNHIIRNPNAVATAVGWGSTLKGFRTNTADVLQEVQLSLKEGSSCGDLKSPYPDPKMVLCAGGQGRDTCRGDSGGPLMLTNRFGNRYHVIGITSIGPSSCGKKHSQALYTNVEYYVPWIRSIIGL